jgi:hypothetical protein
MSGRLQAPAAVPPRKEPLVPIGEEAGWDPEYRNKFTFTLRLRNLREL